LIVGAAVAYSAIINCDETDYFFKPYRQPDNWARKGHVRIRQTEFTGVLHSQSELGKKKGHHEGPGYYAKAMKEGVIPMAIAFDNFVGNNANYSKTVFSTSLMPTWQILSLFDFADIKNYIHDPDWKNTFEWYKEIIQPNGAVPSYDDTKINTSLPSLACTKDPKLSLLQGINLMNSFSDVYQTGTVSMNATWEKYVNSNWSVLTHYTDQIKATDTLSRPSTYKITVIDNNVGKVEYDQVNIWVQQNIQPQFFVQFQIDSTLYFSNQSEPIDYSTQYLWDFGNGQTSTQLNPIHTFPFFDSSYIVCLSATNLCGTFSVCDTIRADSSGLIAYSYAKKLEEKEKTEKIGSAQLAKEITIQSFPNPIKNEISFVYDIPQAYENGEIILMNYVGQTIQKSNIKNAKGLVKMNLDGHSSGMYLYQIIIDARVVKTGKLVKE
jgi:hypothetical protein